MNDCPICGVEFDEKAGDEGNREATIETDGERRVCAQTRFDKHNYAYVELYIHEPVAGGEAGA